MSSRFLLCIHTFIHPYIHFIGLSICKLFQPMPSVTWSMCVGYKWAKMLLHNEMRIVCYFQDLFGAHSAWRSISNTGMNASESSDRLNQSVRVNDLMRRIALNALPRFTWSIRPALWGFTVSSVLLSRCLIMVCRCGWNHIRRIA